MFRWLTIFFDVPADVLGTSVSFWAEVTDSELSPWRGVDSEFATLVPPHGDAYLRVQRVHDGPGGPGGPGGHHLDLHVDPETAPLDEAAKHAVSLGARIRHREDDVIVLDSPGGFPFCLVRWEGEVTVPDPVRLAGGGKTLAHHGGASRLDQLCLDIPPDGFEAECAFWAALTGWEARFGALPEFRYLARPRSVPVRLLLQRRAYAGAGERVTAHVDFACDDPARLADRHVAAGARVGTRFPLWITMADPAGRAYCLTSRDPVTGKLRAS